MVLENVRWLLAGCTMVLTIAPFAACTTEDGATDPPGQSSGAGIENPPDCAAGAVRDCSVPIGTQGNVLTCTVGEQTCGADETWGECIGETVQRSGKFLRDGLTREQLEDPRLVHHWWRQVRLEQLRSLRDGEPSFGDPEGAVLRLQSAPVTCDSPCDPDCMEFPDPTGGTVQPPGTEEPPPPGADPDDVLSAPGNPVGLTDKLFGSVDCLVSSDCHADTYCEIELGLGLDDEVVSGCVPWPEGESNPLALGPDLTIGLGCGDPFSDASIPLCNRGSVNYTGNVVVEVHPGNSSDIGNCTASGAEETDTLAIDLDPGECTTLPVASHPFHHVTGNNKAFIVDPAADDLVDQGDVPEGAPLVGGLQDCNNWGFWNKNFDCATCGVEVPNGDDWDCDDGDEPGGCTDCEVRLHEDDDEENALTETMWADNPAFVYYRTSNGGPWLPAEWVWDADGCTGAGNQFYLEGNGGDEDHYHLKLCSDLCATMTNQVDWYAEFLCYDYDAQVVGGDSFQASCPDAGTAVQWQYIGWNAVTPEGTNIVIEVRAATTEADLASATWVEVADISSSGASPACLIDDPDADCPFSLFDVLGGPPESAYEFIEVRWTLNSNSSESNAPTLYDIELLYTCPDSE
jgi:hypothetical protein